MSGHGVMYWVVTAGIQLSAQQLTFVANLEYYIRNHT